MAFWSAENATKAYLKTLKMGQKAKEPNTSEFISALAAGNNAQLMVVACAGVADYSYTLALVAAAHQTGGRVVCILNGLQQLILAKRLLGVDACHVQFVVGDPQNLLLTHYNDAEFVLIDCNLDNHESLLDSVRAGRKRSGAVVVGYNAFSKGSWRCSRGSRTQLLPIGEGLLVTRIPADGVDNHDNNINRGNNNRLGKKSHWVVKIDQCTGEEHVFRVRFPQGNHHEIEA